MENLKKFQKISKILYILSKIFFIFSIVGCASCFITSIVVGIWGKDPRILQAIAELGETFDYNQTLCYCICGTIQSGFMIALYYYVKNFYQKELEIKTPFSFELAKDLKLVAWLHIILPFASALVCQTIALFFKVQIFAYESTSILIGIIYLMLIPLVKHGAELKEQNITIDINDTDN